MKKQSIALVATLALACAPLMSWAMSHGGNHAMDGAKMPVSQTVKGSDCWVRLLPAPAPSGGFFMLQNSGKEDAIVGAASAKWGQVMVHQTTQEGGMSRMSMVEQVPLPAGGKVEFKPGGYHLMFEKPAAEVAVGDTVPVQLMLKSGARVDLSCEVKPANAMPAPMSH